VTPFKAVTWAFSGRVVPDLPKITIPIVAHEAANGLGCKYFIEGHIEQSIVSATVRQLAPTDRLTLNNAIVADIQGAVDLACLHVGAGLLVEAISARADDGDWIIFDGFIPALKRQGSFDLPVELFDTVAGDAAIQGMLADYREAMRVPVQTGFFCYRAVEAAMQTFKQDQAKSDAAAWALMRDALRVDRNLIDRIKRHADWARHGRSGSIGTSLSPRARLFKDT